MSIGTVLPLVPRIPSDAARPTGKPLPELWRLWWQVRGSALGSPNSVKSYRRCEQLSRSLPDFPTPGDVVTWLAALGAGGMGPGTVAMHRDILHGVYTVAQQAGWASSHPVALAPWRRPRAARVDPIRNLRELWPSLLAVAATPRERAFLAVLRFLGVRLEEALGLEALHVLRRVEPWRVEVAQQRSHPNRMEARPCKGDRSHRVLPVPPELRELLDPVVELPPEQLRFGTRGMARTTRAVPFLFPFRQPQLDRLRDALAGVAPGAFPRGRGWHAFRRARAWELREAGKPIRVISEVLGHESEKTTETYFGRISGAHVAADAFEGV